ncbi:O-antigen ligase family protein, partial [Candidatus Eisenbacteria bacterium]
MATHLVSQMPRRAFWITILTVDLALLLLLPKVPWVALAFGTTLLLVALLHRVEWVLALILLGMPLLDPIPLGREAGSIVLFGLRVLLVGGWLLALKRLTPETVQRAGGPMEQQDRSVFGCLMGVWRDPRTWCLTLLTLWLAVGLMWTDAPEYGTDKLKSFLLTGFILFLIAAAMWPVWGRVEGVDGFIRAGLVIGGLVAAVGAVVAAGVTSELFVGDVGQHRGNPGLRLSWLGTNAIWLARILSVWVILLLWGSRRRLIQPLFAGLLVAAGLFLIVRTGSRGPLIALLTCPLALLLLPPARPSRKRTPGTRRTLRGVLIGVTIAAIVVAVLPGEQKARFVSAILRTPVGTVLGSGDQQGDVTGGVGDKLLADPSARLRWELARRSLKILGDGLPWGVGTGSYAASLFMRDFRIYPHNLEAEILIENGLPGGLLLLLFLLFTWGAAWNLVRGSGRSPTTAQPDAQRAHGQDTAR